MSELSRQTHQQSTLYTEPSFCIYADDELGEEAQTADSKIHTTATIGPDFSFAENDTPIIDEEMSSTRFQDLKIDIGAHQISPPIDQGKGDGGDAAAALNKWKNHAQYLESTGDLYGAEENYFQAAEADPKDGEMLSQYAQLVWQLHGDQARASHYFEKAAMAAPANSDVLAARASFLWDIDESEEEGHLSDDAQVDENPVTVDSSAEDYREETRPASPPLHLAMGLGINDAGIGDHLDYITSFSDDSTNVEAYHRRMVEENPRNPNFLRDYAIFLHQSTGDLYGAEENYFRAAEADPKDGEMLSQYAKLVWQLHGDQARASHYFEKAAMVAPANSDVLAARASFLWDIDESEEEGHLSDDAQVDENPVTVDSFAEDYREETRPASPPLHLAMGLGINDAGIGDHLDYITSFSDDSTNVEAYHRRMVEENPRNPNFLRDYAIFLHQTKGDLEGAEEYYARGILEDPRDGQMLYLYADVVWQLHHDKDRATAYFERAVEASPNNSNVLAAYAKFLWESEGEEAVADKAQRSSN